MHDHKLKTLCDQILFAMFGSKELVEQWWVSDNKDFDTSPDQQWKVNPDSVYQNILKYSEGMW